MSHTLISAAELAALLADPTADVRVLDCRFSLAAPEAGGQAYAQGHVPRAVHVNLDRDLSGPKTGLNGRHPLPSPEAFHATLQRWGLQDGTEVVAYDDAGGMFAARAWWMLRWAGHERVRVLDGGWPQWLAHGGAVAADGNVGNVGSTSNARTEPSPARAPSSRPMSEADDRRHLVRIGEVQQGLGRPEAMQLIDARAPDRFRGENETLDPVGGHIPGALNRFYQQNLAKDGRFKPADQLREEFRALLGTQALSTVVHQCGSGVTACHNLLAMEHAGLPGSRLYAGSWSEWCADPGRLSPTPGSRS